MNELNKVSLAKMLAEMEQVYHRSFNPELFFRELRDYPIEGIIAACREHMLDRQTANFPPKPGDILWRVNGGAKRYRPDEAWGIAIAAADPRNTLIWTDEIAEAWAVAEPIYQMGDKIGARMAFRQCYERVTSDPTRRPRIQVSQGYDFTEYQTALLLAVEQGLLPPSHSAIAQLPVPEGLNSVAAMLGRGCEYLLEGNANAADQCEAGKVRGHLAALRARITGAKGWSEKKKEAAAAKVAEEQLCRQRLLAQTESCLAAAESRTKMDLTE
jgi:hypothetical protein